MSAFILLLLFLVFFKSEIKIKSFNYEYISSKNTLFIKGIFTLLVFYRHCSTYIVLDSIIDKPMILLNDFLFQNLVAMFFFYSGFGIYERIKQNGYKYIKQFPIKRLLTTYINFFIAIVTFLIMDIILDRIGDYSLKTILLSFIGWESIGNSNWYMFVIFLQYIFIILSFNIFKNKHKFALFTILILNIIYSIIVLQFKPQHWMNTSFCLVFGMFYSNYKEIIERKLMNNQNYFTFGTFLSIVYIISSYFYIKLNIPILHIFLSLIFIVLIIMFTMKTINNSKILSFLGKKVFWIYILQRIPMIVLTYFEIDKYEYIFFISSFIITIIIAIIYNFITSKLNGIILLKLDRRLK